MTQYELFPEGAKQETISPVCVKNNGILQIHLGSIHGGQKYTILHPGRCPVNPSRFRLFFVLGGCAF